ncbi:MAG: radical SAM family heme chaperone HemW [Deltaproteobacteria bacterium]|nr:radical SAM family heme chaperone HemW [Deltaproteobacteria bacterium]
MPPPQEKSQLFGLYVHIPFCLRRCFYCDFYSINDFELFWPYLEALKLEASLYAPLFNEPFDSLYLGGGSPSLMTENDVPLLFEALAPLKLIKKAEVTIEANPEDITPQKAAAWVKAGINRVSLGVQSFNPRHLSKSLGRFHKIEETFKAISCLAEFKLALSLDLLYAYGGQTINDWRRELEIAALSQADHLSCYVLTAYPGTSFYRSLKAGLITLADEEMTAELFMTAVEVLNGHNFECYEVSNFARNEAYCQHNLKYWCRIPYLGLGPSAHSFDGANRWANLASLRRWGSALKRGSKPLRFKEKLTKDQIYLEQLMLSFRLAEGCELSLVKSCQGLEDLITSGKLKVEGSRLKPTYQGLLVADALARALA